MPNIDRRTRRLTTAAVVLALGAIVSCSDSANEGPQSRGDDDVRPHPGSTPVDPPNRPPRADFEIGDSLPEDGDPVTFDASSSRDADDDALTYAWQFGDGSSGSGARTAHVYSSGGDFEVTLTVVDEHGRTDSATETVSIKETPLLPGDAEVTVLTHTATTRDVQDVEVSIVGSPTTRTTGPEGRATFEQLPTGRPLVFRATKEGYAPQVVRQALPEHAATATVTMRLREVETTATIDRIEEGAAVELQDGARLDFPPRSVVDQTGDVVEGAIRVDVTTHGKAEFPARETLPGSATELRRDGTQERIGFFGGMTVTLRKDGERLHIKPGKRVETDIPSYAEGLPTGGTVHLASLDESTGLWVEEGRLEVRKDVDSPSERVLRAEIPHFSTWVGAYPLTTPCKMKPRCKITDIQQGPDEVQYGEADIPLKSDQTCEVEVYAQEAAGLGDSCQISSLESSIAGESCAEDSDCKVCQNITGAVHGDPTGDSCQSNSDCTYETAHHYEQTDDGRRHVVDDTDTGTCALPGQISCDTTDLPPDTNKSQPDPGGNCNTGVCESPLEGHEGVQFCDGGKCALPDNDGVYENAAQPYNQKFTVGPKGEVDPSTADNPEAQDGWMWVPNKDLILRGVTRRGTLHGASNVQGDELSNEEFDDGSAPKCNETRPVIPMRHECADGKEGLTGNCPKVKRRHFCDLLFKCPEAPYARSFTQDLGIRSEQECIYKLENDFKLEMLVAALENGRLDYDGDRGAICLDRVAAIRQEVNEAIDNQDFEARLKACSDFNARAFKINNCTGVVGTVAKGEPCVHNLECKDKFDQGVKVNRSCEYYGPNSSGGDCFGTCVKSVNTSRVCGGTGDVCDGGEYCNDNDRCVSKKQKGARCDEAGECKLGLYCDLDGSPSICKYRKLHRSKGSACNDRSAVCEMGLTCSLQPDSQMIDKQICQEFSNPDNGNSCLGMTGGGQALCEWDAYCNGNQCKPKKDHGASCSSDYQCLSDLCIDGSCFGPEKGRKCPQ